MGVVGEGAFLSQCTAQFRELEGHVALSRRHQNEQNIWVINPPARQSFPALRAPW